MGEKAAIKPGWYAHPSMANTLCYWDGSTWTDQLAPALPGGGVEPRSGTRPLTWVLVGLILIGFAIAYGALADDFSGAALFAIPGEAFISVGVIAKGVQVGIWSARG